MDLTIETGTPGHFFVVESVGTVLTVLCECATHHDAVVALTAFNTASHVDEVTKVMIALAEAVYQTTFGRSVSHCPVCGGQGPGDFAEPEHDDDCPLMAVVNLLMPEDERHGRS